MADLIDPTQTGNYPVILGDGLLGKTSNDIFTGVRYNHKPPQSNAESSRARLKPSIQGQTSSYDLLFPDKDGRTEYAFAGVRNTSDGQYVLYFDPDRQVFVLDRIDSTFNMNVTRMPGNTDPDNLSRKYPHLGNAASGSSSTKAKTAEKSKLDPKAPKPKPRAKSPPRKKEAASQKPTEKKVAKQVAKQPPQSFELALPKAEQPKPPKPHSRNFDEEDEDEDDDGGLLVEYPGGEPKGQKRDFSPALKSVRRFDDFMDQRESEADDADGESEDEAEATDFKLPSPVNPKISSGNSHENHSYDPELMDEDDESDQDQGDHGAALEDMDDEDDLEKDLEMAFEAEDNSNSTPANGDESEISEED